MNKMRKSVTHVVVSKTDSSEVQWCLQGRQNSSRACGVVKGLRAIETSEKQKRYQLSVMESRDLVWVSRLVLRPIFASLGLECFKSRLVSKTTSLETLNIANKCKSKISDPTIFCLLYLQVKNNQNRSENARNWKKLNLEVMTTHF